MRHRRFIN